MAYPSLKKMGNARTRGEGNYASSKCPPREDITKLELGLTLLPGSQTLQGGNAIFKYVDGKRPQSKNGSNQEQYDGSPVGHRNEPQPSPFISSYVVQDSQRGSQTVVSSIVARQYDEENEFGSRELSSGNSSFTAGASEAVINIMSHHGLSSPVTLIRYENDDIDGNEDEDYEGKKSSRDCHYLRCLRRRPKVDQRGYTDQNSRNYVNKTSQPREISTRSGTFQALSNPEKYEDVSLTVFRMSSVNCPRSCHDSFEKLRAYVSSAASENERIDIGMLGQNRVVKATWQSTCDWEERCSEARGWSTVNGGEGLESEINDGSDYLKSESVPKSPGCETCMDDSLIGCSSPEPGSAQSDSLTYSIGSLSSRRKVSPRFLRRESAPSVLLRTHVRSSGNGTNPTWDSLKSVSTRLPGQNQDRSNQRTLVPDFCCDNKCNDGKPLLPSTPSFSSSLISSTNHLHPQQPLALDVNQSSSSSLFATTFSSSSSSSSPLSSVLSILGGPRKRSISLPNLHPIISSVAMDYSPVPHSSRPTSQAAPLNLPFQSPSGTSPTTPLSIRPPLGQSGLVVPAPALRGMEVSSGPYNDMSTRWQMTLPFGVSSHYGLSADVAYSQRVDVVKRLQARVQELERDNGCLIEKVRKCNLQNDEMRMHLERRNRELYEDLQSRSRELQVQRSEALLWRHRAQYLERLCRQRVPKRSSAATLFETMGRISPEANSISQPILPFTGPITAKATETDPEIQFKTAAQSFSVWPEAVAQASAALVQTPTVVESIGTSAETSIDLTTDGSPDIRSISHATSAASLSGPFSKAQDLDPVESIHRRVNNGAKWMGEAHPSRRVKRPATYGPTMEQVTKRIRPDTAVSGHRSSTGTAESAEASKTAAENKRAQRKANPAKTNARAVQKELELEQEQREKERARELEREAKLRDDHKRRQDQVAVEKAQREARLAVENERAWQIEEQQSSVRLPEEAFEAPSNDEDTLTDLFEDASDDEEHFGVDKAQVDGEGKEEDDGLEADLEAAMAEEEQKARRRDERDMRKG